MGPNYKELEVLFIEAFNTKEEAVDTEGITGQEAFGIFAMHRDHWPPECKEQTEKEWGVFQITNVSGIVGDLLAE